ncbi:zinc metalloproteinase nas-36-like isoform X2 [Lineus longissimus]|uniref:zinc metalloproteinase nas-36-like isoform X2 n=1 Tax=Lineus longissimus TaxID=88925 RepID=UPI002B4CD121
MNRTLTCYFLVLLILEGVHLSYVCPPELCPSSMVSRGRSDAVASRLEGGFNPFFEGDIVLDKEDSVRAERWWRRQNRRRGLRSRRETVKQKKRLWPKAIVPFTIDPRLPPTTKKNIAEAILHYERFTCLRFRPRKYSDVDYIRYSYQPGCWSYIGRQGGPQRLVLGKGCEKFGTIIHETGHALGLWHEQSRLDRDKYVKVIRDNVSPRFLKDFGVVGKKSTTSRGYPYDYESVMHYGEKYFTINGKPTLEVIGIGKALGLKIGQREGLSALDAAQLGDMYQCQTKNKRVCDSTWVEHKASCYKFFRKPPKQFGGALDFCKNKDSELLSIDDRDEDTFIKKYLTKHRSDTATWRTGGKKDDYFGWIWQHSDDRSHKRMSYQKWADKEPAGSRTTLVLKKEPNKDTFKWRAEWAGSYRQLPAYSYGFICERDTTAKGCFRSRFRDGRDYRGDINFSDKGLVCQKWTSQWPHQHTSLDDNPNKNTQNGLGDHNFCRNPEGRKAKPWCYVTKQKVIWQYCNVNLCSLV